MKTIPLFLLLLLPACSAVESALPATTGEVEAVQDAFADELELRERALQEAQEGDGIQSLGLYLLAALSGLGGAIGLSRRRRKIAAREDALLKADPNTPKEQVV